MSAGSTARAGAAYEAVLVDKVTAQVDNIVQSLEKLRNAFEGIKDPANQFNQSMSGIAQSMRQAGNVGKTSSQGLQNFASMMKTASATIVHAGQSIGQTLLHIGNQVRNLGALTLGGAGGLGWFLLSSAKEFSSAEGILSAFNSVFGKTAGDMDKWVQDFAGKTGRSLTDIRASLIPFKGLFSNLDLPENQINEFVKMTRVMAQNLAAAYELTDDVAVEQVRSAFSGEPEVLKKYGIYLQDLDLEQMELAKSIGLTASKMTQQEKLMLRFIKTAQTLEKADLLGQFGKERDNLPNQIQRLASAWKEFKQSVGSVVIKAIADTVESLTIAFKKLSALSPELKERLIGIAAGLTALGSGLFILGSAMTFLGPAIIAFTTAIGAVGSLTGAFFSFATVAPVLAANLAVFGPIVFGLAAAFTALFAYFYIKNFPVQQAFDTLGEALGTLTTLTKNFIKVFKQALMQGNWADVWELFVVSGQLAFYELAAALRRILIDSLVSAWDGFIEAIRGQLEWLWPEGLTGIKQRRRPEDKNLPKQVELLNRLLKLTKKYSDTTEKAKKASDFFTGKDRSPADYAEQARQEQEAAMKRLGRIASLGTTSSLVASQAASFGPKFDPIEKESKTQTGLQKRLVGEAEKLNRLISEKFNFDPLIFSP